MMTQQSVLSVISHNVANANTTGYTRQVARLSAIEPAVRETLSYGNGVQIDGIDRKRDRVLDSELRQSLSDLGRWGARTSRMETLEGIINEPSDSGLNAALDEFWNSWSELSSDPDDQTRRAAVREQGRVLAYRMNTMYDRIQQTAVDVDSEIVTRVNEFNLLLGDLRNLNTLIKESTLQGDSANDLRDRRDLLLDEINQLAPVSTSEREDGTVAVRLGHTVVLDESQYRPLEARIIHGESGGQSVEVTLPNDAVPEIASGQIGGLIELRDETVPGLLADIDTLATSLIEEVNALHSAGPSGVGFFSGTGAGDLVVAAPIEEDIGNINSSTSGLAGDNDIALAIAQLGDARLLESGTLSLHDYWGNVVGGLGVASREASFQQESLTVTTDALKQRRDSIGSVSLDEEMTNVLAAQQAYLAAVKIFQAAEDMMDTLMAI